MQQKHIFNKHLKGELKLNKSMILDIAELIRLSPTAARILFLLASYADNKNTIITTPYTIGQLLGLKKEEIEYHLRKLIANGYIECNKVKLSHSHDIYGVVHDTNLYDKTNGEVWEVIDEKLVTTVELNNIYNRFWINDSIIKCSDNGCGNIIKHIKGNLFYDNRINNDDIIWEL